MQVIMVSNQPRAAGAGLCLAMVVGLIAGLAGCGKSLTDADFVERAKSHQEKGELRAAVVEYKNALRKNPDNPEARLLLGKLYVRVENGPAAVKELERAQELNIPLSAMVADYAQALVLQGKFQEVLDRITERPNGDDRSRAAALAARARAYMGLGKLDESHNAAREALRLDAGNTEALLGMARIAAVKGDLKGAIEQATQVAERDKHSVEARLLLGELHRLDGNLKESMDAYAEAVSLNPYSLRAYLARAQVALATNDLAGADEDVQSALKLAKKHPFANYLQGKVLFKKGQYQEALSMFQKVSQALPGFRPVVFWLGLTNAALGQFAQAEDFASSYLKLAPNAVEARKLKAYLELKQKNPAGALQVLASLEGKEAQDTQLSNLLGTAYMQSGEVNKGVGYLRQVAESSDATPESRAKYALALLEQGKTEEAQQQLQQALSADPGLIEPELAFIQKLMEKKQYDAAAKALDQAEERHPKAPRLLNLRGGLALSQGKIDEATQAFHKALELEPGFPEAAHNLALLALRKGDREAARGFYMQVIKQHPDHVPTLLALYYLDKQGGKAEQAMSWVEKVVAKQPGNAVAATLLARDYLARGDALQAVSVTEAAIAEHPKDAGLLEVRGLAQLGAGQAANALHSFTALTALRPKAADAYFYLAQAQAGLGKVTETRKALERTLSLDPKHWKAKGALARLEMRNGNPDRAAKLASELEQDFPKLPEGWLVQYALAIQQKHYAEASQTMQQLMDKGFVNTDNVLNLARAQWAAGNRQEAVDRVAAWLKLHSKDVAALLYMAEAQEGLGDIDAAQKRYEEVLALAPRHPVALNNLAWLLRKRDPGRALSLAEEVTRQHPDSAAFADTLAVILMDRGDDQRAVEVLRGLVGGEAAQVPPTLRYHYAQALARTGNEGEAKALLSSLVNAGGDFPEKAAAQALLQQLSGP